MEYSRKVAYNTRYMIYQSFLLTLKNRKTEKKIKIANLSMDVEF